MATPAAEAMSKVVGDVSPLLKAAGFRKRRNTFNREVEPGMVHVVNFQMGSYDPSGTPDIPGFRQSRYGSFTINVGVYVPEMILEEWQRRPGWVNEYNCQLRKRIGELLDGEQLDRWWPLSSTEAASANARDALTSAGLLWLDRFPSRAAVVEAFVRDGGQALGLAPRGPIEIASLLAETDRDRAEVILRDYIAASKTHPEHLRWLETVFTRSRFEHLFD